MALLNHPDALKVIDRLTCDPQASRDLLEWSNRREWSEAELLELARMFLAGRFRAWDCPTCSERVFSASPESWDHWQGARQDDYQSYPGGSREQCDYCRCHRVSMR